METGVVAPKAGVGIDGEDSRENLGKKEKEDGNIQGCATDGDLFLVDPLDDPGGGDEDGQDIDKKHFVEFKHLGSSRPENERHKKEESVEQILDGLVSVGSKF